MIILDLFAEANPVWKLTEAFYGHPFIWCMRENFSGNHGLHGAIQNVATGELVYMFRASWQDMIPLVRTRSDQRKCVCLVGMFRLKKSVFDI